MKQAQYLLDEGRLYNESQGILRKKTHNQIAKLHERADAGNPVAKQILEMIRKRGKS